jgi:transposase
MGRPSKYSKELRERAVRLVLENQERYDSQWAAIVSIAEKIGCSAEVLRKWLRQAERDGGQRPGLTTEERERLKRLERENFELRRSNEILRKASAYFAQAGRCCSRIKSTNRRCHASISAASKAAPSAPSI